MAWALNVMNFCNLPRPIKSDAQLIEHVPPQQHVGSGRKGHFHQGRPNLQIQIRGWRPLGSFIGELLHESRSVNAGDVHEAVRAISKHQLEVNNFFRKSGPDALDQGMLISIRVNHPTALHRDPAAQMSLAQLGPQLFISRNLALELFVSFRLGLACKRYDRLWHERSPALLSIAQMLVGSNTRDWRKFDKTRTLTRADALMESLGVKRLTAGGI